MVQKGTAELEFKLMHHNEMTQEDAMFSLWAGQGVSMDPSASFASVVLTSPICIQRKNMLAFAECITHHLL